MEEHKTKMIAVVGKGGVGKTSLAAAMVKVLTEEYPDKRILAIDADPAVGLSSVLQVEVKTTIDDIRKEVVQTAKSGDSKSVIELLSEAKYRIYDAIVEQDGYAFIAIGRPESAGCYCKVNSYLKEIITMISSQFDYVIIDGEAGIEQINRRVMEKVTHLLLVTDASKKGCQVVQTIKQVADELVMYEQIGVIANRLPNSSVQEYLKLDGLEVLSYILTDDTLALCDMKGENVLKLPDEAAIVKGTREALCKIGLIGGQK